MSRESLRGELITKQRAAISLHPRAQAFERNKKQDICTREGHIPPTRSWYSRSGSLDGLEPCRRCGERVQPITDWSGHP
jgi:hypothetical protein